MLSDSDRPDYGNGHEHEVNSSASSYGVFVEAEEHRDFETQALSAADANTSTTAFLYTTSWERHSGSNDDGHLF
jgi:hypothetical protein